MTERTIAAVSCALLAAALGTAPAVGAATAAVVNADACGNGAGNGIPDQFRVALGGGGVEVHVDGCLAATFEAATLASLTVNGSGDDDTLTVDFGGGNPIPGGGLFYHGGGNGAAGDALRLINGEFPAVAYTYFNATDGSIDLGGSLLTFTGLEPITDTVPAGTLIVNATHAHNAVTYMQGPLTTQGLVSIDNFETITFQNKALLMLNTLNGNDDVVLGNANVPTGLTAVTVNCSYGDDKVYVALDSPVAITLNGGDGDDVFRVNPSSTAVIQVDGGEHVLGDLLRVNRRGSRFENRKRRSLVWLEDFQNIPYAGVERFGVNNN